MKLSGLSPEQIKNLPTLSSEQIKDLRCQFFVCEDSLDSIRLFNLTSDPYENVNLALNYPSIVTDLKARLSKYFKTMIKPDIATQVQAGNPNNFGGFFNTGWCKAWIKKAVTFFVNLFCLCCSICRVHMRWSLVKHDSWMQSFFTDEINELFQTTMDILFKNASFLLKNHS